MIVVRIDRPQELLQRLHPREKYQNTSPYTEKSRLGLLRRELWGSFDNASGYFVANEGGYVANLQMLLSQVCRDVFQLPCTIAARSKIKRSWQTRPRQRESLKLR